MNLADLKDKLRIVVIVAIGIIALLTVILMLASLLLPNASETFGLGSDYLLSDLETQKGSLEKVIHFRPLLDLSLFLGSYIFISLLMWVQHEIRMYVSNRRHFE